MISVFTPTHRDGTWLLEAFQSLLDQVYTDWSWTIVPNNGGVVPEVISSHPKVRVATFSGTPKGIGDLKRFACDYCIGDILVELDDDDLLTSNALQAVAEVFTDSAVQFAYSNTAEFRDQTWEPRTFSSWWGWKTRPFEYRGHKLEQNVAWPPGPWSLRHIYWSPNHLRAWRTSAYRAVGGHNPDLALVDDHDLNIRMYLAYGTRGLRHIDKCLYLYRLHGESTCREFSKDIRKSDTAMYQKYIEALVLRWVDDQGLPRYDLGGALDPRPGYTIVDTRSGADIQADLEEDWPFDDDSVGLIRASHLFEHLRDPIHTMNELYRVLAPGGWGFIEVPSTDGRGAFQDPTHVSFWNENSFWYYTRSTHSRYIPEFRGRFQVSNLMTYFPNKFFRENDIPIVQSHLIALKPGYERRAGEILI